MGTSATWECTRTWPVVAVEQSAVPHMRRWSIPLHRRRRAAGRQPDFGS